MIQMAWVTDCHLNFLTADAIEAFFQEISALAPDGLLLGGDIGHGAGTLEHLVSMAARFSFPVYFVLGNHDYYSRSIDQQRRAVQELCEDHPGLVWLPASGVVSLTPECALIGHGGWGDGRYGDFERSPVRLNDYIYIEELSGISPSLRLERLHSLGDQAAAHVRKVLPEALESHRHVVFLTHVPPTRESCTHEGKPSDDDWAPHFACKAVGDALLEIMAAHPQQRLTVLCGHTHGEGYCQPLPHVEIFTGGARYYHPEVQRVFTWGA